MDTAELNDLLMRFGRQHKRTVDGERRVRLAADLFDVPRRSSFAGEIFYAELPDLLRELKAHATPEQIARRMKLPGARPNYQNIWALLTTYLTGRQQRLLDAGIGDSRAVVEDRLDDLVVVMDFFASTVRAYREDAGLFPGESGQTQRVLPGDLVTSCLSFARPPEPDRWHAIRRAVGSLTLYAFVLHGEQRDGTFTHGPYRGPDDTVVWFEEITDLRNLYLPWAIKPPAMAVDNVVFVQAAKDVEIQVADTGACQVVPPRYEDRVVLAGALTRGDGNELRAVSDAELGEITQTALASQGDIFWRQADWTPQFRVEYGRFVFGNHLEAFLRTAGITDAGGLIDERFGRVAPAALASILSAAELPSVHEHMLRTTEDREFSAVIR